MAAIFNSYEFVFAGESSLMYGLQVYDLDNFRQDNVPFGNSASIVETRSPRRITPLHFGVNYNSSPLQFKLVFGAEKPLDRYDLEAVSLWLTGYQQYQWLSICQDDLENVEYRCLITQLQPISLWWLPVAFEATVTCDCPYAYSAPWEETHTISGGNTATSITFRNESTVREYLRPQITFTPASSTTSISIVNTSDNNREFKITDLASGDIVFVDGETGVIQDQGVNHRNLYGGFNLHLPRFVCGDNALSVKGDGTLKIGGRFLRNVAG